VPTAGEAAVELVFPAVAGQKTNVDNIPGLIVDVITVDGGNYVFQGLSGATLTFSGVRGFNFIAPDSNSKVNNIEASIPLVLAASTRFNSDSILTIKSVISGQAGLFAYGKLSLQGTSANTYNGTTNGGVDINLNGPNWISPGWEKESPGHPYGGALNGVANLIVGDARNRRDI